MEKLAPDNVIGAINVDQLSMDDIKRFLSNYVKRGKAKNGVFSFINCVGN